MRTDGSKRLEKWLRETKTTQTALALRLHTSQAVVSRWVTGALRPESANRETLAAITGITPDAWITPKERRLIDSVNRDTDAPAATGTEGR